MKQIVRAPPRTSSATISAASASVLRRVCSASSTTGRVPHRDLPPRARRAVSVHERDLVEAGEPLGQLHRVGDRRAGQEDPRLGPVGGGDPPQAAQDVGDVRAEHAAVDVRLVDHDHGEVGEEVSPSAGGWAGSRRGACRGS
jgi:hypothetical protein